MKLKTTKKAIKENYNNIIEVSYCSAQYLLNYKSVFAYSTRAEGWACDYYDINGVCISTGYAPIGKHNYTYDMLRGYELKAEKVVNDYSLSYVFCVSLCSSF